MAKKDKINLDEIFGEAGKDGFGTCGFGNFNFGGRELFDNTPGFKGDFVCGRLPHYAMTPRELDVIDDYENEISKSDSNTRDDLINIDIELGRLSAFNGYGGSKSRIEIKKHVSNITKRYREAVLTLSTATCILGLALVIERIKNRK